MGFRGATLIYSARSGEVEIVASPTLEATRTLLAYWQAKCPPDGLPGRDGGADWVYRLIGTAIVNRSGRDATGMRVRELFAPEIADSYIADYRRGAASRAPWLARGTFAIPGTEHVRFESAGLPIIGRDGVTVWLLLSVFYLD